MAKHLREFYQVSIKDKETNAKMNFMDFDGLVDISHLDVGLSMDQVLGIYTKRHALCNDFSIY